MEDVWTLILAYTDDIYTFRGTYRANKMLAHIYDIRFPEKVRKFRNPLKVLIEMYPDKNWNWQAMHRSPHFCVEIFLANLDKLWNWCAISKHPEITWDIICDNPQLPWDTFEIHLNPNITWDIMHTARGFMRRNRFQPWKWDVLSANPNITWDIIQENHGDLDKWNIGWFCAGPNISIDIILANPNEEWDWITLSDNPVMTREIILTHRHLPWDWNEIMHHNKWDWNILLEYQEEIDFRYVTWQKTFLTTHIVQML